jgi:predicted amidophosphoribosyltransferase
MYICNLCRFTFKRTGKIENCPDCGKPSVREATDKEIKEYIKNREIYEAEEKQKLKKE